MKKFNSHEELSNELFIKKIQQLEIKLEVIEEHYQSMFRIDQILMDNLDRRLCKLEENSS